MRDRRARAILVGLVATGAATASHAAPSIESVGAGVAIASPVVGASLLLRLDDRWTGALGVDPSGTGAQVQVNYSREGSRGGYWTAGGGRADGTSLVRAGYGYAWRLGAVRLHLEATLNLPFDVSDRQGLDGFATGLVYAFPIGLGVHYVFGER